MDLFKKLQLKKGSEKHQNFTSYKSESDKKLLNSWVYGIKDKDGKFVKEFQTTYNSTFWEIYLYGLFKELGFEINQNYNRPDFILNSKDINFIVEATIAEHSKIDGKQDKPISPEWEKDFSELSLYSENNKTKEFSILKILGAIFNKWNKYHKGKNSYNKLDYVKNKPFVIALAPFEKPFHYYQYDELIKAVLYNEPIVDSDELYRSSEKYKNIIPLKMLDFVTKENGTEIPLGLFLDDSMSEISAVIFNPSATFGKVSSMNEDMFGLKKHHWVDKNENFFITIDEQEIIEDGLFIFHNPFAKYPLDKELFKRDRICQVFYNKQTGEIIKEFNDKHLYSRLFMGTSKSEFEKIYGKEKLEEAIQEYKKTNDLYKNFQDSIISRILK
jgi:hypothetical protein